MTRAMRGVRLLAVIVAAVLGLCLASAGAAHADPDQGWMPDPPKTLDSSQKSMLTEIPLSSDDEPRYGDQAQKQYRLIECDKHRDFPGCEKYGSNEDSKNVQAVVYDVNGNYKGVWAATPEMLAREHAALADDQGVIDCSKAADKIPSCSMPELMKPDPPISMKYDKSSGEFVGFQQEDGSFSLPGGRAERNCESSIPGVTAVRCSAEAVGNAINPAKKAADLLDNWFAQACETVGKFAGDLLVLSMTWWLRTDSIDVTSGDVLSGKAPVQTLVIMIIFLGVIGSATGMVLTRRPGPAAELAVGALKFILIASMSGIIVAGAVNAADDFAKQIITSGADEFGPNMRAMLGIATLQNPSGVLGLGLFAMLLSTIQWIIGFARQAGLVVLFALLIFAAAGQLTSWGRQWFPRIVAMMISLILYKPMAACIYSIGFKLMGDEQSLSSVMVGIMTLALAILAMPAMLKFFSFVSTSVAGGVGAGAVLGGAGAAAGTAAAAMSSFGSSPGGDSQSNYMDSTGPGSTGGTADPDPSPGNTQGGLGNSESSGSGTGGESGGTGSEAGAGSEADLGSDGMGPASEAGVSGGEADGGVPVADSAAGAGAGAGVGAGAEGAGAAGAAGGGAAAANPYVAGAMAAKAGVEAVGGAADSLASEATGGDDTGPDMQ